MKFLKSVAFAAIISVSSTPALFGYSGEDVLDGLPFHHFDITIRALAGDEAGGARGNNFASLGFSNKAATAIAWHADFIDSYLYSPLFWSGIGDKRSPEQVVQRIKGAFSQYNNLVKLHFDDTFTTDGIIDTWQRYGAGTLAGLEWAFQENDVAAAYNVLGVSVHAVQDFYSHSNWVDDPARREKTWLETPVSERSGDRLYSGSYELPTNASQHSHGKIAFDCTILGRPGLKFVKDEICTGFSPFANTNACVTYRHCISDRDTTTISLKGQDLTNTLVLHPSGIALDSSWLAQVAGPQRNITDSLGRLKDGEARGLVSMQTCTEISNFGMDCELTAEGSCVRKNTRVCETDTDRLFGTAKFLAIKTTQQWVTHVGGIFSDQSPKHADFWRLLQAGTQNTSKEERFAQFEDFTQFPFQFLSTGPYPVGNAKFGPKTFETSARGYYLRLDISTADTRGAGTDSDIYARVHYDGGRSDKIILDYMPTNDAKAGVRSNRLLAYNDFEAGDRTVYTIGPFPKVPRKLELGNLAADGGDVFEALVDDFVRGIVDLASSAGRTALSIIAGNGDFVGETAYELTLDDLERAIQRDRGKHKIRVDGGKEGIYEVEFTIDYDAAAIPQDRKDEGWLGFQLGIQRLRAIKESTSDRGSDSDEPFTFLAFTPLNGSRDAALFHWLGPFEDVDTGETRRPSKFQSRIRSFTLPPGGTLTVSMQQWEHDEEPKSERTRLFNQFKAGINDIANASNGKFLNALGASIASDWEIGRVSVFGFYRGGLVEAGPMLTRARGTVLGGGDSQMFTLSDSNLKRMSGTGDPAHWRVAAPTARSNGAACDLDADCDSGSCLPKAFGSAAQCCAPGRTGTQLVQLPLVVPFVVPICN